jgi:hypothetical protein
MLKQAYEAIKGAAKSLNLRQMILAGAKEKAKALVIKHGDRLQERIKKALAERGPDAVDAAIDGAQALLIAEIESL